MGAIGSAGSAGSGNVLALIKALQESGNDRGEKSSNDGGVQINLNVAASEPGGMDAAALKKSYSVPGVGAKLDVSA